MTKTLPLFFVFRFVFFGLCCCFLACETPSQDLSTQKLMRLRQKYGCSTILRNSTIDKTLTIGFMQCDSLPQAADDSTLYVTAQRLSVEVYKIFIEKQNAPIVYERIAINLLPQTTTIAASASTRQAVFMLKDVQEWAKR